MTTALPAAPAESARPDERRRRILVATIDVVRERGFAGARVADIARAAGTSPGLVLYHFGSLAGALTEALTWLEDTFYVDVDRAWDDPSDPVQRLRYMAELGAGSGPAIGNWELWLELWVRALRDERARASRESLDRRWRAALTDVITAGVAAGVFRPADPWVASLRLACLMDGLAVQLALGDADSRLDPDRFRDLWLGAAALELGVPAELFTARVSGTAMPPTPSAALRR